MKFANEERREKSPRKLGRTECVLGEIYELAYGRASVLDPAVCNLRICVNDPDREKMLVGLKDGIINASVGLNGISWSKDYIHRPDIQLVRVET
jgi:hypothetical protein